MYRHARVIIIAVIVCQCAVTVSVFRHRTQVDIVVVTVVCGLATGAWNEMGVAVLIVAIWQREAAANTKG